MRLRIFAAVAVAVAMGGSQLRAQPFIEKLPKRTLLYVGANGASPELMDSKLGKLLEHPSLASLPESLIQALSKPEGMSTGERQAFESIISAIRVAITRPLTVSLVSLSKEGQQAPRPEIAVMVDLGEKTEAFTAHYDVLVKLMRNEGAPLQETEIQGAKLLVLPTGPDMSVTFGLHDRMFYLFFGKELAREVLNMRRADSLAANEAFSAAMSRHPAQGQVAALFARGTQEWLRQISPYDARGSRERQEQIMTEAGKILEALGIGGIESVSATVTPGEQGRLRSLLRIDSPAPHKGLLSPFAGPAVADADFADTGADVVYAAASRIDPGKVLLEVAGIIRAMPQMSDSGYGLDGMFNAFESATGVHPLTGIYDTVGDSWLISLSSDRGGFPAGLEMSVVLKDASTLRRSMSRLTKVFNEMMLEQHRNQRYRRNRLPSKISVLGEGDEAISYVAIRERHDPVPLAPAWQIRDGRLRLAAWPQILQASGPSPRRRLVETEAYKALRERLPGQASMVTWADEAALVRQLYPWALTVWTLAANAVAAGEGVGFMPDWLTQMPALTETFGPAMTVAGADEKGVYIESEAALPLGLGIVPALLPAVQSASPPAVALARENALRTLAAVQMRNLTVNLFMYSVEHEDRMPDSLEQLLVWAGEPQLAVSPMSGKEAPEIRKGKLVGDVDYVYVRPEGGKLSDIRRPARHVVFYEDAGNYGGKATHAAFADGHVEWLTVAELERRLNDQKRKK